MAKLKDKPPAGNHPEIPEEQWDLPVTYNADGSEMLPLREMADPNVRALSLSQLTPFQRANLVAKRIELQPKFEVVMIGAGMIDKKRAVAEVIAQSEVGRVLIEIEHRVLTNLMDQIALERTIPSKH